MTLLNNLSKRDMILLSLLVISLITVSLYQTLATDITMNKTNSSDADLSFIFDITDQTGRIVNVKAGVTKVLDIFVTNGNSGTIKYGIAYTPSTVKTNDVTIAQLNTSKDKVSGLINKDERKQITIVIVNNSISDISLTLVPVTGYEHGGDLIVPNNHTLITEEYVIKEPLPSLPYNGAKYIEALLPNNLETMNNDDPDGNVRYMGAAPNNYVSFNNELWRIIGVFDIASTDGGLTEKRLKIIRNETIEKVPWDSNEKNDWTKASLQIYLNGEYYNNLDLLSQSFIENAYWNLGGTGSYTSASNGLASHFYGYERGTNIYKDNTTFWIGKIALIYPSDYGYATSGGATTNRESCLAKEMYSWDESNYSDCKNNNYLYNDNLGLWMLTTYSTYSSNVFVISSSGRIYKDKSSPDYRGAVPVLYLKSTVQITGGIGTSENPFTLG